MSKMSDIFIEIQDRLSKKEDPKNIAEELNIPISWVYGAYEVTPEEEELYSPYKTYNS
jgi:hypothetical protein